MGDCPVAILDVQPVTEVEAPFPYFVTEGVLRVADRLVSGRLKVRQLTALRV